MNERKIILITIVGASCFVVLLVAFVLTILFLRRRCSKLKMKESDRDSLATTTTSDAGLVNLALDEDGLVSATKLRTPEERFKTEGPRECITGERSKTEGPRECITGERFKAEPLDVNERALETRSKREGLDPKLEEMLDNAYADARQFAKFPHMP